jgi:hypothetical protein
MAGGGDSRAQLVRLSDKTCFVPLPLLEHLLEDGVSAADAAARGAALEAAHELPPGALGARALASGLSVLYTCVLPGANAVSRALAGALCCSVAACFGDRAARVAQLSVQAHCGTRCACMSLSCSANAAYGVPFFRSLTAGFGALAVAAFRAWGFTSLCGLCAAMLCLFCASPHAWVVPGPHCVVHVAVDVHVGGGRAVTAAAARAARARLDASPRNRSLSGLGFAWGMARAEQRETVAARADLACLPQLGALLHRCPRCGEWHSFHLAQVGTLDDVVCRHARSARGGAAAAAAARLAAAADARSEGAAAAVAAAPEAASAPRRRRPHAAAGGESSVGGACGAPEGDAKACANPACGSAPGAKTQRCSGCRAVRYCGAACAKEDWARHRGACRVRRAGLGTPPARSIDDVD